MKNWIKAEELMLFVACIIAFNYLKINNYWFWLLLLLPDISAIGYLLGNKVGAVSYNVAHHKGVAILVGLMGLWQQNEVLMAAGIILLAHSSIDRVFGYGLKLKTSFQDTHLGSIGKQKQ